MNTFISILFGVLVAFYVMQDKPTKPLSHLVTEAYASDQQVDFEYIGVLPHGVQMFLICVDGQKLAYSYDPRQGGSHITAPFIKDDSIGIDLPTCKKRR